MKQRLLTGVRKKLEKLLIEMGKLEVTGWFGWRKSGSTISPS